MRGKRKKTYVKQMFVVEKNNDNKFTFDDRSALLKYKTPYSPRSRLHDPSTRVASGSRIRPLASLSQPLEFKRTRALLLTARPLGIKKSLFPETPGRG
ncbi:hypothetical protein SAMN05720758_1595 [Fibrobacter sp. UWB11]|nr:hypothetical protein SAMN05720758_1595 [Fibrobacter sp. UWB11]